MLRPKRYHHSKVQRHTYTRNSRRALAELLHTLAARSQVHENVADGVHIVRLKKRAVRSGHKILRKRAARSARDNPKIGSDNPHRENK